jgi:hypothetical protein
VTHDTTEISLGATVRPFGMPTGATALTGVAWVNGDHTHACALCLVGNKLAQLREGPIAVSCSLLRTTNPYPLTNALQIFQGDSAWVARNRVSSLLSSATLQHTVRVDNVSPIREVCRKQNACAIAAWFIRKGFPCGATRFLCWDESPLFPNCEVSMDMG